LLDEWHLDIELDRGPGKNMLGRTFCPLGDAAAMPTISIMKKWRGEFEETLKGRCASKSAEALVDQLGIHAEQN